MKTIKILVLSLIVLLSSTSCEKFTSGFYKDPNGLTYTVAEQELTGTMLENQFFHKADGLRLAMMWMNQATGANRQYQSLDDWNNANGKDFNGPWNEVYLTMTHADIVIKMANQDGNEKLSGLGKLYKAWAGGEAASLWGDVPFSQLNDFDQYPDPVYDSQSSVFDQVQTLLDEAIIDLNSGIGSIPADRDIYFRGDVGKWIKIAHALKARFYLHSKQFPEALAEALLGPSSIEDDLYARFESHDDTPWGKWNPTKQFMEVRSGDMDASKAFANKKLLNGYRNNAKTTDLRKAYYYGGNGLNTAYLGNKQGAFFGDMPMVTYGEMLLIATEAKLRDNSNANRMADALVYYNTYRDLLSNNNYAGGYNTGNFSAYDVTDFDQGGLENQDNIDPVKAFMREVFEERYVFFIGDYESYIDFARSFTDPDVPSYLKLRYDDNGDPLYSGQPLRFIYAKSDEDANDNFPGTVDISVPLPVYQ